MENNKTEHRTIRCIDLEETYHDLQADYTALLIIHDCFADDQYDRNALEHLWWDRLSLLHQHVHDIKSLCGFGRDDT